MTLPANWRPSAARTVQAIPRGASARGVFPTACAPAWPAKASVEQLDYTLDLSLWMADALDTAEGLVVQISPAGTAGDLAIGWQAILAGNATLLLIGGRPGVLYTVGLQVTTAAGRVALFDVALPLTSDPVVLLPAPSQALLGGVSTGQFYADAGARLQRFGDRLLIGAAADNPGDANRAVTPTDWLSTMMGATSIGAYATWGATTASLARFGSMGLLGGSRTSDAHSSASLLGYTPATIGIGSWAIDDDVSSPRTTTAYAYYGEVWRMPGVVYQPCFAQELEVVNLGGLPTGQSNPYQRNIGGGAYAIQLGSGGGQTSGTSDAESALTLVDNPSRFRQGIVIAATALTGTDGATGGYGSAFLLAAYQGIEWRTPEVVQNVPGALTGAFVRSIVTIAAQGGRMEFQNGACLFTNAAGQAVFSVATLPNANNALQVQPGAGAQAAGLYVQEGAGGSPNLALYPAAGGELQIASPVQAGNALPAAPVQFMRININGSDLRIPVLTPAQAGF